MRTRGESPTAAIKRTTIAAVALSLLLAACAGKSGGGSPNTAPSMAVLPAPAASLAEASSAGPGSSYHVTVDPAHFTTTIDNPWFPLIPGTTYVYKGVKDGKALVDKFEVTSKTKVIDGVTCVVVSDQGFLDGKLAERTNDYYTQDDLGNVWYFGEDTQELNADGSVNNTSGTWHAGVNGAQPGVFMQATPVIGASFRQEYLAGQAEDQFTVASLTAKATVPYGTYNNAMLTVETSALEPAVTDHKLYVKGIGEVSEVAATGPTEKAVLVSMTKP